MKSIDQNLDESPTSEKSLSDGKYSTLMIHFVAQTETPEDYYDSRLQRSSGNFLRRNITLANTLPRRALAVRARDGSGEPIAGSSTTSDSRAARSSSAVTKMVLFYKFTRSERLPLQ